MKNIMKNINYLCDDLKNIIWSYIRYEYKSILTKKLYIKFYFLRNNMIPVIHYQNYIRSMIRMDNNFIIKMNLKLHFKKWLKKKNIYYKDYKINNYVNYLLHLCFENNSNKCEREIKQYIKNCGLEKSWYKRIILKNNKWKT